MLITLPDGSQREYPAGATGRAIAESIGAGLARAAVGVKVDGELRDLDRPIEGDATVAIVTRPRKGTPLNEQDADALYLVRHSAAHVMAEAIERLWPATQLAYGPPLETGFYYDFKLDKPISSDDFEKIEAEMRKIVAEKRPFTRYELEPIAGMEKLEVEGNKYKLDNAERALEGGAAALSWYVTGEVAEQEPRWEDLCQGPHVPTTGDIGAFKITTVASSHWHGDVEQDRFQRVYGTAFYHAEDLEHYLQQLDEAKQRDHRVIGSKLKLFTIDEQVGQGLILWKPAGASVRTTLQNFLLDELVKRGYDQVYTPHIGKIDLYETSGHYPYYSDSQFPPIQMRDSEEQYLLRPMNCPHHIKIFASDQHSYRDLPVRLAEFGTVYRFEQSGELTGMTRVRGFTQDDAHIFCTADQVAEEFRQTVELVQFVFETFGFEDVSIRLSLRDPKNKAKYAGDSALWDQAENELRAVLQQMKVNFTEEPGEAAFYGPKVDFVVRDVIGRPWQLGTVQLDYNLPERFGIEYTGADNRAHRPVMIHRAPFGSMERFMAILIEHFAGAFPLWLAPEQVRVLPVSDKFRDYAVKVLGALKEAKVRATLDDSADRVQAKIRVAQEQKVPYMLIVGGRDESAGTVSVRDRSRGDIGALTLSAFLQQLQREIQTRGQHGVQA
ncbi:MAG: threonine--tRNA ligase [Phycisphaeraceae bacterium]